MRKLALLGCIVVAFGVVASFLNLAMGFADAVLLVGFMLSAITGAVQSSAAVAAIMVRRGAIGIGSLAAGKESERVQGATRCHRRCNRRHSDLHSSCSCNRVSPQIGICWFTAIRQDTVVPIAQNEGIGTVKAKNVIKLIPQPPLTAIG